jgi:uncharacterized membrane protein YeiB
MSACCRDCARLCMSACCRVVQRALLALVAALCTQTSIATTEVSTEVCEMTKSARTDSTMFYGVLIVVIILLLTILCCVVNAFVQVRVQITTTRTKCVRDVEVQGPTRWSGKLCALPSAFPFVRTERSTNVQLSRGEISATEHYTQTSLTFRYGRTTPCYEQVAPSLPLCG